MRNDSAARELSRIKGERSSLSGYEYVPRDVWARRFATRCCLLAHASGTKLKTLSIVFREISVQTSNPNVFFVRYLDDPEPVKITLSPVSPP